MSSRLLAAAGSFSLAGALAASALHRRLHLSESEAAPDRASLSAREDRVITVRGTAFERGAALERILGGDVAALAETRRRLYSAEGVAAWRRRATTCEAAWREHAPVSWRELEGQLHTGARASDLLLLATDYEQQMESWRDDGLLAAPGRCTAFALTDAAGGAALCGQNVDEACAGWFDGKRDVVVRHVSSEASTPHALLYTHPGVPAYCGLNSAGLCVLNLYIDEPPEPAVEAGPVATRRGPLLAATASSSGGGGGGGGGGVPIDVVLREMLAFSSIEQATAWLERLPRTEPSTYVLMQAGVVACVEASPSRVATLWLRGDAELCHSNHPICDQRMQAAWEAQAEAGGASAVPCASAAASTAEPTGGVVGEGGGGAPGGPPAASAAADAASAAERGGSPSSECSSDLNCSSVARLDSMRRALRAARRADGGLDVFAARQLLEGCPPVHETDVPTLSRVLLEPEKGRMHIRFRGEAEWRVLGFADDQL